MGLFETINKKCGYSEEQMLKVFRDMFSGMDQYMGYPIETRYPIAVSFAKKVMLFSSTVYASGFATILNTGALFIYVVFPFKAKAMYDLSSAKKMKLKNSIGGKKYLEATLLGMTFMKYDDLILRISPKVPGFPNQEYNMNKFLEILNV